MSSLAKVLADEEAAYELLASRWEVRAVKALDPGLFERLEDQQRIFHEVLEEGDDEESCRQGLAMIRGWQAALKRMEDREIACALAVFPGSKVTAIRPKS